MFALSRLNRCTSIFYVLFQLCLSIRKLITRNQWLLPYRVQIFSTLLQWFRCCIRYKHIRNIKISVGALEKAKKCSKILRKNIIESVDIAAQLSRSTQCTNSLWENWQPGYTWYPFSYKKASYWKLRLLISFTFILKRHATNLHIRIRHLMLLIHHDVCYLQDITQNNCQTYQHIAITWTQRSNQRILSVGEKTNNSLTRALPQCPQSISL